MDFLLLLQGQLINRDEGAYLGYVGKASDGMVDVQLISDLHKSEVYACARFLDVPDSIIGAVCTGDMFDGRVDEEVFGTSYDFVELYLWYLNLNNFHQEKFKKSLDEESLEKFNMYASNLENLHSYNAHKYLAGSPAVHLDIFESNVKGGWQIQKQLWQEQLNKTVDKKFFKHLNNFSTKFQESIKEEKNYTPQIENNFPVLNTNVKTIDNMFTPYFLRLLKEEINNSELENINEIGGNDKIDKSYLNKSKRINIYNPEFSDLLWNKIKEYLPKIEAIGEYGFCETDGHVYWKAVGVNPYIKLSQYNEGGMLVPHYDGVHRYNNIHRNMKTLIVYLEDNDCCTRILNDHQQDFKVKDRVFKDGNKNQIIVDKDILFSQNSVENKAIIFDNKLLHDSTVLKNGRKTILLTEVVYEKIIFPQKV